MRDGEEVATPFDRALDDLDEVVSRLVELANSDGLLGYGDSRLVEVMQRFERLRNRLPGVDHGFVAAVNARELPARLVSGSPAKLLSTALRLSPAEASRRVRAAAAVAPGMSPTGQLLPPVRPLLAAAQAAGEVSTEHVAVVESALRRVDRRGFDPTAVASGEKLLVGFASSFGPPDLARLARQVVDAIDPDGTLPDDELIADRRFLHLRPTKDGSVVGEFRLTPACGAKLQTVLGPLARPRPDVVLTEGQAPVADGRAHVQRMHDGLEEICDRLLRSDSLPDSGGTPATVVVTMSADDLITRTGVAITACGSAISVREALRLAGEAEIVPAVLAAGGELLTLGRTRRIASPSQTLALAARDGGCSFPGCDRPPDLCERHHVVAWADGGLTDLNNLTLLCRYHHHNFAERGWTCEINPDGLPQWRAPRWVDPERPPQIHHRILAARAGREVERAANAAPGPRASRPRLRLGSPQTTLRKHSERAAHRR